MTSNNTQSKHIRLLSVLLMLSLLLSLCSCGSERVRLDLAGAVSSPQASGSTPAASAAAAAGSWDSIYSQAADLFYVNADYNAAFNLLSGAENSGHARSEFLLALCRRYGFGCEIDCKTACELFNLAANDGYAPAFYLLADTYQRGYPVDEDHEQAAKLYSEFLTAAAAYDSSLPESGLVYYYAGRCALLGLGCERNAGLALSYAEKALECDYTPAVFCYDIAADIQSGRFGDADIDRAQEIFTKLLPTLKNLAESGCPAAEREYAQYFLYGEGGITYSAESAFEWMKKAADAGDADALRLCGTFCRNGTGTDTDYEQAMKYYKSAASLGSATAKADIGLMYQDALGVKKNNKKAAEWYSAAIAQGNEVTCMGAYNNLGYLYQYGIGLDADIDKAVECYGIAADFGDANGLYNLALCYENGTGVDKDTQKALQLYTAAAQRGNEQASSAVERLSGVSA